MNDISLFIENRSHTAYLDLGTCIYFKLQLCDRGRQFTTLYFDNNPVRQSTLQIQQSENLTAGAHAQKCRFNHYGNNQCKQ